MKLNIIKNRKGTALIVALLVMGVLMAISLALSALVLRESMITRDFLDAGQSYYAAESASEIGLYGVKNNLPGWEPGDGSVEIRIDGEYGSVAELVVFNKCKAYPCFDEEGYDLSSAATDPSAFYATLGLNESATIPLFVVENGAPTPITGFTVEFYSGFQPGDLKVSGNVSDWDVLRWKIVGLKQYGDKSVTESISDFTAVSMGASLNGKHFTDAASPSWFGTIACSNPAVDASSRLTSAITCFDYKPVSNLANCNNTQAREFYLYETDADGDRKIGNVESCYSLDKFITGETPENIDDDHQLNYLTLTNLINPAVLGGNGISSKNDSKTKLFYRIELFTDKGGGKIATDAVREYADITADGYSGKSKQSVNVKIKRDSFMPVFNFSLYSTYQDPEHLSDWEGT